ncbi:amino acid ABC transporter ATP-binding/permease protein [Vagococcus bubulae]|uniref:ABC transporter ATP-binding protein n=1 Tax=Vagococcus bubulae TaxID=1977868 RepID=A0A429ZBZ8_9ENTE|nr:ABC transporter ATP-binding protein [Vagococcus bubulae]RST91220.1 hypothetical protein CBF36_10380 [Vagococcus bubulae]
MRDTLDTIKWLLSFIKKIPFQVLIAVILGVISYCCVIYIPYVSAVTVMTSSRISNFSWLIFSLVMAILFRGIARYGEQYMNHYIAFHTLADVRHELFKKLRTLAPAKLLSRGKGDYIALITSDVEMLEIFFAHTVSPVLIATIMGIGLVTYFSQVHLVLGLIALGAYVLLGILVPSIQYRQAKKIGDDYKTSLSNLNQTVIEMSEGKKDIQQYGLKNQMLQRLRQRGDTLNRVSLKKTGQLRNIQWYMELIIALGTIWFVLLGVTLSVQPDKLIVSSLVFVSSFGPFIPLSMLGNELLSTLSSAKRLRQVMNEKPAVNDVTREEPLYKIDFESLSANHVSFSYQEDQPVLQNVNLMFPTKGFIGIQGESGRGKSTFLYLLMRFFDVSKGSININERNIKAVNTRDVYSIEGYMSQTTDLFTGTIRDNIGLGMPNASDELIEQAAKKASVHEWIMSLPNSYDTEIKQGKRDISDGEKQRIGLARLFLHDAPVMILDEPTSHLDYLNEQIILRAIEKERYKRLIVMVSHRETSLSKADNVIKL